MKIKDGMSYRIFTVLNYVLLTGLVLVTLYPLWFVVCASFSDPIELLKHTGLLFKPLKFSILSYKMVMENSMILTGYINSIILLLMGIIVNMICTVLGGYVLSRKGLRGKSFMMIFVTVTMFFSGGMIPLYLTVRNYGLYNSLWAIILPGAVSTYNLIIMRTAFSSVPESLEEAAKIEGAGHLRILADIVVPLSMSTIAVVALYYAVGHWNSWFYAMLFIKDREKYPLQLVLREILIQGDTANMTQDVGAYERNMAAEQLKYAVIVVSALPMMLLYPFVQKHFVKGVMIGAIKG